MGFPAAHLSALRDSAALFFDTTATRLRPVTTQNSVGAETRSSWSAVTSAALFRKPSTVPKVQASDVGVLAEVADWQCLLAYGADVATKDRMLKGVTTFRGTYSAGTAYIVGDGVEYSGKFYVCIQAGTGQTPSTIADSAYWTALQVFEVVAVNTAQSNKVKTICDLKLVA